MMLDRSSFSQHYAHLPPTPQLVSNSSTTTNGLSRKPSKYNNLPPPNNLIVSFQPPTITNGSNQSVNQLNHPHQHQIPPTTIYNSSISPPSTSNPALLQPNGKNLLVKRVSANQLLPSLQTEKSTGNILRSISPTPQTKNFMSNPPIAHTNPLNSNKSFTDVRGGRAETSLGFYDDKKSKSKEKDEDKERLYTKYIEKLRVELDKKKRKIKELNLEIKRLNQQHISNDIDEKLIKFRSTANLNGEGMHTYFEETDSSSSEEEIEEMFEDEKEETFKSNKVNSFDTPKKDSPSRNMKPTSAHGEKHTLSPTIDRQSIIDTMNASRDREVKELEGQLQTWKDLCEKLKDEITSTRSEFLQHKIRTEEETSKLVKEIQRSNSSQNFEEETKVLFYKNLASHYETENKKNLVMIDKLQTELKNEKCSGTELEDLVVKQQKNLSDYQDRANRELSECRKEIERLRRIVKMKSNDSDEEEMSATFQK